MRSLSMKLLAFASGLAFAAMLIVMVFTTMNSKPQVTEQRLTPTDFLAQFDGRVVPNERPPRDEIVAAQAAGIPLGLSQEEAEALLDEWYVNFYTKKEKGGPNPIAYAERMDVLARAEAEGRSPSSVDAVSGTAKMLMIPFEFGGTDIIPGCDQVGGTPIYTPTVSGPLKGTIPDPALDGDNNTIYAPGGDFDIPWYEDLIFGDGVGVVRTDLNGGSGVDLTGVSAQNWYLEQSEGIYTVTGAIYTDWVTLDHSVAWYGWDGDEVDPDGQGSVPCNGTPSGYGFEFVIDIAEKLNQDNPNFDWSEYDVDGDGVVDHLMVIHAGVDNSAGGGTYGNYQLWAHSWDVYCDHGGGTLELGCLVDDGGTPGNPDDDIYIANYTHIPEDADIGVVVHEYGHDIGLPDYYDQTGATSNSTAHWIVMSSGSWSGELGGSHPAPFNPWARYFFGWETPMVVDYDDPSLDVVIGQSDPTPMGTEDSVWINLPDQELVIENLAGDGTGLHAILGNNVFYTLTKEFDLSSAAAPVFSFNTYFEIEEDWDYTYLLASTDGGANWDILLNDEGEYGTSDPNGSTAWLGVGGLTGSYSGALTYDLSTYAGESSVWLQFAYVTDAGVQDPGIWVDDFSLDDGATNLYSNDLENSSDWINGGWEEVPYSDLSPHYYMLEWRNDAGSIASVGHNYQYQSLVHNDTGWLVDHFPANTPGLLIWYRNTLYSNNQAINGGREFASPATGPKGELLLVDSHYEPVNWSDGWWDAGSMSNRRGAMDGAFTFDDVPSWMIHDTGNVLSNVIDFGGRPAVSSFHDSQRSVPGWVFPGDGFVYRADQDASVVIPGRSDYTTRIRGIDGSGNPSGDMYSFWGFTVGGQELGSGNPGDSNAQYGVNIELIDAAVDGTWGEVRINNRRADFNTTAELTQDEITTGSVYTLTYQTVVENTGVSVLDSVNVTYTLDLSLTLVSMDSTMGTVDLPSTSWSDSSLAAGEMVTITVVTTGTVGMTSETVTSVVEANDGTVELGPWFIDTVIGINKLYMPIFFKP